MKRIFIVNPIAGNGNALKISKDIKHICAEEKFNYEIIFTTGPGHAKAIAQKYRTKLGENIVYSVGGDGTLNEIVNGIANSNTILGVIPGGTGNDFYRSIGYSCRPINKIDIGKVNDRYFINIASLGLDANIAQSANELKTKNIPNSLVYYISIIKELIKITNINLLVDNRQQSEDFTMLSVCNGAYYGGGIKLAPHALINDGVFDIYEVSKATRIEILKVLKKLIKMEHDKSKFVNYWKTDYLVVESLIPLICNVDGEIIKSNKFVFENIEEGLHLLYEDHPKIMKLYKK